MRRVESVNRLGVGASLGRRRASFPRRRPGEDFLLLFIKTNSLMLAERTESLLSSKESPGVPTTLQTHKQRAIVPEHTHTGAAVCLWGSFWSCEDVHH